MQFNPACKRQLLVIFVTLMVTGCVNALPRVDLAEDSASTHAQTSGSSLGQYAKNISQHAIPTAQL